MTFLRQSTNSQGVVIGPFVDSTDGATPETSLSIANSDVKLSSNGSAPANKNSGGGTHVANGCYAITLDSIDTTNVGELFITVNMSGALPVVARFQVVEESVYDQLFAASAAFPSNFADLAITSSTGKVTVGTNDDKDDYTISGTIATLDTLDSFMDSNHSALTALIGAVQTDVDAILVDTDTTIPGLLSTIDTEVGQIKAVTDKVDTGLEDDGSSGWQWTILALENGPSGSGSSPAAIAAEVWGTAVPGAFTSGEAGEVLGNLNDLAEADIRTAVGLASANLDTQLSTIDTEVGQILVDTGTDIPASFAALNDLSAGEIRGAIGMSAANLDTQLSTIDTEVGQIKTETDKLTAAHTEPTGAPAANESPLDKLGYIFMALRNKTTVTSSAITYFDDGGNAEWSKALSDDGTTYTEAEGS